MRWPWLALSALLLGGALAANRLHIGEVETRVYLPNIGLVKALDAAGEAPAQPQAPAGMSLLIPKLQLNAPVDKLGADSAGRLIAPTDWDHVGWFEGSARPGSPGTSLMMGHVDSHTGPAVFFDLRKLQAGDEIDVQDGARNLRYHVTSSHAYPESNVPMEELLATSGPSRIALVTCAGEFSTTTDRYDERLIVEGDLDE